MSFLAYMHVERFGTTSVEGIEHGTCFVFPKIDGSNASVWAEGSAWHGPDICAGSRTRQLSLESDNAGFLAWCLEPTQRAKFEAYFAEHPTHRLFGEWLVPHTLKTYRKEAWRRFWIFDVQAADGTFLSYDVYNVYLEKHGLDYVVPMFRAENIHFEYLLEALKKNTFLIEEGAGLGEGVVVKNYDFVNRHGEVVWAKVVRQEFKEENAKAFGINTIGLTDPIEKLIVDKFVTDAMIDKVIAKIVVEDEGWSSTRIPRLLNTVFYDLVKEETWEFIKEHNLPTVSFKSLKAYTIQKVKTNKKELF